MNLAIMAIARIELGGTLLPLAALTRVAPAPTVAPPAAPLCKGDEPGCSRSPYPMDIMAIYALYQSVE